MLRFKRRIDFSLNPRAPCRLRGKNQEYLVMHSDRFVYSNSNVITDLQILRCKPTPDASRLQVSVQSLGKALIHAGVADKARIEFNGFCQDRWNIFHKAVRQPTASEKVRWQWSRFRQCLIIHKT